MTPQRLPEILTACYIALVAIAIAYELGIRVHDMAHAEFAGWLSAVLTLPTVILVNIFSAHTVGVRMGDSNTAFVLIPALAGAINAAVIYAIARTATRQRHRVTDR
jgi:hypothetical protein